MALALSRSVPRYRAVERDPHLAADLAQAGLDVVHGEFPLPAEDTFDLVLSSHSVPEDSLQQYLPFLSACWTSTSARGSLLIITFKGSKGDLAEVQREVIGRGFGASPELEVILDSCARFGETRVERVNSYIESSHADELVRFLTRWLSASEDEMASAYDQLLKIITTRYKVRDKLFVFPTEHLFISCHRR